MITLLPETLDALWHALNRSNRRPTPARGAREIEDRLLQSGWVLRSEIGDLLSYYDDRLSDINIEQLLEPLDLKIRTIYGKPKRIASIPFGCRSVIAADVAALLVTMEKLGFNVDPSRLAVALEEGVAGKERLTTAEYDLLVFKSQRHKHYVQFTSRRPHQPNEEWTEIVTATGYKVTAIVCDGAVRRLSAKGPRYRVPRPTVATTCGDCGCSYDAGDAESGYQHRLFHRREMRVIEPRINLRLANSVAATDTLAYVEFGSPKWMHREVYERAARFRRELGFDFVQWPSPGPMAPLPEMVGVLFINQAAEFPPLSIVGAGAFVRDGARWRLNWVWISPFARRSGVLHDRWNTLLERFGDFEIETPLSDAMVEFIRTRGTAIQQAESRVTDG